MRITVEISEEHHRALTALADRSGVHGLSPLVREALAQYLGDVDADELTLLLGLEGTLSEAAELEFWARVAEVRSSWRTASSLAEGAPS
jgi:hypothetical protein